MLLGVVRASAGTHSALLGLYIAFTGVIRTLLGVVWGTPDALLGLLGLHIPSVGVDMTLVGPHSGHFRRPGPLRGTMQAPDPG